MRTAERRKNCRRCRDVHTTILGWVYFRWNSDNSFNCIMGIVVRKGEQEMIGITVVLVVFIICATVITGMYICYCNENEVGMFQNPKYEKRIMELEKQMEELKKE